MKKGVKGFTTYFYTFLHFCNPLLLTRIKANLKTN